MSYEVKGDVIGIFPAGAADLGRYTAARIVAGEIVKPTAAGQCAGIVQIEDNLDGQVVAIQTSGIAKVLCSGTVSQDALVTVDTDGKVSAAAGSGEFILGQALEAGAAGKIIAVRLILNTKA